MRGNFQHFGSLSILGLAGMLYTIYIKKIFDHLTIDHSMFVYSAGNCKFNSGSVGSKGYVAPGVTYKAFCEFLYLRIVHDIMILRSRRPQIQMNIDRVELV